MASDKKKLKKHFNYVVTGIMSLVLLLVIIALISLFVQMSGGKKPSLFNYRVYYIMTDSMTPTLVVGDVIVSQIIASKDDVAKSVNVGDVITYTAEYGAIRGMSITHRVIEGAHYDTTLSRYVVTTQGAKAGATIDPPVPIENIEAVMAYKSHAMTFFYKVFTSTLGLVLLIVLPFGLMLIIMVYRLILIIKQPSADELKQRNEKLQQEKIEAIKKKAIDDYLNKTL